MDGLRATPLYDHVDMTTPIWDALRSRVHEMVEKFYLHGPIYDGDRFREAFDYVVPRVDIGLGLDDGRFLCDVARHIAYRLVGPR